MPAADVPPAMPHGPIEPVFDDIWFVQGSVKMPMFLPMKISRSMTVLRDPTGALTLVNSMRLSEAGLAALDALGPVKHVLRIGGYHGRDDGFYRARYGAKVYAVEGQAYTRKMEPGQPDTAYMTPDVWMTEATDLPVPDARLVVIGSCAPPEGMLLLARDGGILVTGDALQNTPAPDAYVNFPARVMMKRMGFYAPHLIGPAWLQFAKPSAAEVRAIADLAFEHVLPGHGLPVIGGARDKYLPQLLGPLKGCHDG